MRLVSWELQGLQNCPSKICEEPKSQEREDVQLLAEVRRDEAGGRVR